MLKFLSQLLKFNTKIKIILIIAQVDFIGVVCILFFSGFLFFALGVGLLQRNSIINISSSGIKFWFPWDLRISDLVPIKALISIE